MSGDNSPELAQQVRVMQIITFALVMGVATFAAMLLLVIRPNPLPAGQVPILSYAGMAFAPIAIIMGLVVPRVMASKMPTTVGTYQTTLIIGAALFEGAAFFNLAAYMIEGQIASLAVAAVLLACIALLMPTVGRVQDWIATRERRDQDLEAFKR